MKKEYLTPKFIIECMANDTIVTSDVSWGYELTNQWWGHVTKCIWSETEEIDKYVDEFGVAYICNQ